MLPSCIRKGRRVLSHHFGSFFSHRLRSSAAPVALAAADRSRRQRTTRGASSPCLRSRHTTGEPHDKWHLRKPAGWRARLIGLLRLALVRAETRLPMYQARASEASPPCRRQRGCLPHRLPLFPKPLICNTLRICGPTRYSLQRL